MLMSDAKQRIKSLFFNNKKVLENYFFMTILQILNSLFYLLIYPYLIRVLGAENYGLYVFAFSIVTYFITFIDFGFDLPGVKKIAQNLQDSNVKKDVLSGIFTAKIYMEIISFIIFSSIVFAVPSMRSNWLLFFICFTQTLTNILFPRWYFQGIQRMRVVTYIQLGFKLLSLPFIFLFVKQRDDLLLYATIISFFSILGALTAFLIIRYKENLIISMVPFAKVKKYVREALPFFATNGLNVVKQQSAVVILGGFFSMKDVALYDLANKIFTVPTVLVASINGALFPKIVGLKKNIAATVKKIIKIENIIGVAIVLFLIVTGNFIIKLMGGPDMSEAFPLLVILSFGIFGQLTVGAIGYFIFIPSGNSVYIAKNQLVAFITFFVFAITGVLVSKSIWVVPLALTLSGVSELIYSQMVVQNKKLLSKLEEM